MGFSYCIQLSCVLSLKKLGSNPDLVIREANVLGLHSRRSASAWLCFVPSKKQAPDASHDIGALAKLCRGPALGE